MFDKASIAINSDGTITHTHGVMGALFVKNDTSIVTTNDNSSIAASDLYVQSIFSDWNFNDIWYMTSGSYPMLQVTNKASSVSAQSIDLFADGETTCEHIVYIRDTKNSANIYIKAQNPYSTIAIRGGSYTGVFEGVINGLINDKTIIPFTITSTSGASQEHHLVIIKEPTLATLDSVVIDGTTVARVNNTYVAEIGKSADSVNAEITPISGTVEVLDKDRNVVSYESMNGLTWINTALPANVGTTTTYTLRVTNGNALSTVEYPLILKPAEYHTGLKYVQVDPLTLIGNVLVGSGYTDVTDINENVYNYVITKDLEYINIKAETVNSTSKVSIASEYNSANVQEIERYKLDTSIKDIYIPIDVTTEENVVEHYVLHLTRKSIDDSLKTVKVTYGSNVYTPTAENRVMDEETGATADVYVVKLDTPGNVPFTNKTYVDILIEANDIYTLVNAGSPTATDPTSANSDKWTATNVLLDGEELTIYEIKSKAADLETIKVSYLYIYKKSDNANLKTFTATYDDGGTKTTVEAGKDIDGEYQLWIPSDVTTVDLEAIASTLLAEVQIDDNTSSLHNNVYKNFTITGKNTINVMIKSSLNTTAEYKININRLNLDLEAVQAGPYSGGNLSNALWDSTRNAYVVRLDPQTDDLPSAIASVLAKDANNYIRIGHLTRPEKPTQGSMTDEQYAAALAQYEKEVAAYETAAANDYSATDASVVWDGGWRQTSNQSYKIPLIKKDG